MAKAKKIKQLVVQAADRVGLLADVGDVLARAKVNISGICSYSMEGRATFMIVTDSVASAKKGLARAGYEVAEETAVAVELSNKAGELAKVASKVAAAGVDLQYLYATTAGRGSLVVLKSSDDAKAIKALK